MLSRKIALPSQGLRSPDHSSPLLCPGATEPPAPVPLAGDGEGPRGVSPARPCRPFRAMAPSAYHCSDAAAVQTVPGTFCRSPSGPSGTLATRQPVSLLRRQSMRGLLPDSKNFASNDQADSRTEQSAHGLALRPTGTAMRHEKSTSPLPAPATQALRGVESPASSHNARVPEPQLFLTYLGRSVRK